jgi:hypothetical protein
MAQLARRKWFFGTEPLVGLREKPGEKVKVLEGNRRLPCVFDPRRRRPSSRE